MKRNYTLVIHSKVQINGEFIREPPTVLTDHLIAYCVKEYPRMSKVSEKRGKENLSMLSLCFFFRIDILVIM